MVPAVAPRVVAVVVSYNRRSLLEEALDALQQQTRRPDEVLVVDNASTDGSPDLVRDRFPDARLVSLKRNVGGAGGFAAGLAIAVEELGADWVWLMDDDTVPTATALAALLGVLARDEARDATVLSSRAVWTDGTAHPMNDPRPWLFASRAERARAGRLGATPIRTASFVSMLVDASAVRRVGLPVADYFIWNDDFEYSARVIRGHSAYSVPASVVVHKTRQLASTDLDPGERFYYEVRNKLWMARFSRGLSPAEKVLFGASSLLRWARTFARSANRGLLWRMLRRGLADGLRTRPADTRRLLASLPEAAPSVTSFYTPPAVPRP
jgi:rhamnopyranosyl-N-acetylglucosaminyl-diphospho-decaprenol beta-1,3/1,4-galactofuranosyltransferase